MQRKQRWLRWAIALIVVWAAMRFVPWKLCVVLGNSMEPYLRTGDVVVINRFGREAIRRGSLVVFRHEGRTAIKKVHALPGDRVTEVFFADVGQTILITPETERRFRKFESWNPRLQGGVHARLVHLTIPPGYVYVIGTIPESCDSRQFGPVPVREVMGVVRYGPKRPVNAEFVNPETAAVPPRLG